MGEAKNLKFIRKRQSVSLAFFVLNGRIYVYGEGRAFNLGTIHMSSMPPLVQCHHCLFLCQPRWLEFTNVRYSNYQKIMRRIGNFSSTAPVPHVCEGVTCNDRGRCYALDEEDGEEEYVCLCEYGWGGKDCALGKWSHC